ncbi:MAG: oligopeptide ABC transporter ATP-binding protein [Thermoprotei archaeon]|nr:MAG: oligopeptide ABC transporter ATP-binding protein [Thermoprotei archaeon]RLF16753.1 MAG: oligopeptide ABC transporter ATP-binding protein [Thermoprotei archaeon]
MELITVEDLKKYFEVRTVRLPLISRQPKRYVKAVDGVSFQVKEGEIFGLVGESGCGKTTTGRLILRLIEPTSGKILYRGEDLLKYSGSKLRMLRRKMQMIFQDPYESINPRMLIRDVVAEPLRVHKAVSSEEEVEASVAKALEDVKLVPPDDFMHRYPHELSGGQRQRVAIARALILNPEFIVADEPVSMLDLSIRAEILNIMLDLKDKYGLTYLFITHDLAVAKYFCDRIAVMYLGKIVEMGKVEEIIDNPLHPYTKALLAAVPVPDPRVKIGEIPIIGEVASPVDLPSGCRFHTRCVYAMDKCKAEEPGLVEAVKEHFVACHLYT